MPRYNEALTNEERIVLSRSIRMMDIMRGVYHSESFFRTEFWEKGVVTQRILDNKVRLVYCHNYNKYPEVFHVSIKLYIVTIAEEPIGLAYINSYKYQICYFMPSEKYKDWDDERLCKLLNEGLEGCALQYSCLCDSDKSSWVQKYSSELFRMHLKFDDKLAAELWKKMDVSMTGEQLKEYRDVIYKKHDLLSVVQKEMIAQELVFYVLPRCIIRDGLEATVINDLLRFVIEEYDVALKQGWDAIQILSHLEELFLIDSLEKAKEYYIANECSVERYRDCCMNVAYKKIMDSFAQWDISTYKWIWEQEALERLFIYDGLYKDWNVHRILNLIDNMEAEEAVFVRLRDYICKHVDGIFVRDTIVCHVQQIMQKQDKNQRIWQLLEECCDLLTGFESRELNLSEKEFLRKAQNERSLPYGNCNCINTKKKIVIFRNGFRIREIIDRREPRHEPTIDYTLPFIFEVWGTEGLLGKLEVAQYHIIWNVIGEKRERVVKLFSEFVRNLELVSPEQEIRYATEEESEYWKEKMIESCIGNQNFFGRHIEWFVCNKQSLDKRLVASMCRELNKYVQNEWIRKDILRGLIFYVLPSVAKNPELCTQQELQAMADFMQNVTNVKFRKKDDDIVAADLIDTYAGYCRIDTVSKAKKIYTFFHFKKIRYANGEYLYYSQLWEEFQQFDFTPYEREWAQEVFDQEIDEAKETKKTSKYLLSAVYVLDLLEMLGGIDNYRQFIAEYEKYWNKDYILFRLEKMQKHVTDAKLYDMLDEFCKKLKKEICVEEN